jgi:hypothetical protein
VLFDDFFDNDNLTDEYITQLINKPNDIEPGNDSVKLAIQLYGKLLEGVQHPESIQEALNAVFKEQVRSKKQKNSDLTEDEIKDITFAKGGTAFLLYRKAFGEISTRCEEKFYYTLGAIMQLENDIFDVYKDRQEGIRTLVTACHDIKPVRNLYLYLINELFEGAQQLPVNPKAVAKAMRVLMLVICRSRKRTALYCGISGHLHERIKRHGCRKGTSEDGCRLLSDLHHNIYRSCTGGLSGAGISLPREAIFRGRTCRSAC